MQGREWRGRWNGRDVLRMASDGGRGGGLKGSYVEGHNFCI